MTFTTPENRFKEIKQDDAHFRMTDGIRIVPRAAIEISKSCPHNYKLILSDCIDKGWVMPVAYVKESDYVWEVLAE